MTTPSTPQHHIIKETSEALTRLFQEEFKRNGYKRVHVVDVAPKPDSIEGKLPAVSLYLYQLALDPEGWDGGAGSELVEVPQADGSTKEFFRRKRIWIRCEYLLSAWAQTPEDEQLLLGLLLRTILDNPLLNKEQFRGGSYDESIGEMDGLPVMLGTRLDEGTLSRFWGSLNQPVRPAINVWTGIPIVPEKMSELQRVRSRELNYRNVHDPRVNEQGPSGNPFAKRLDLGGGGRSGGK